MKHTSESLAAMIDFECNKVLFKILGNRGIYQEGINGALVFVGNMKEVDYCNNPSDVMPLVFEYGISLITTDGGKLWFAEFDTEVNAHFILCSKISIKDQNPLRAAACCLILVLQEIKEIEA